MRGSNAAPKLEAGADPQDRVPTDPLFALIVDDDPVLHAVGCEALEGIGFDVRAAATGELALDVCAEVAPDLVVLDIELPGRDGFAVCEALRARPELADVPILMITGRTDAASIDRAFEVGATDFVPKPIDWQLVQHRVRFLVRANSAFRTLKRTLWDLEDSRRRLDTARELAHIGTWELAPESGEMLWSGEVAKLLTDDHGATPPPNWSGFLERVHPDDLDEVEKVIAGVQQSLTRETLEHRLLDTDGRIHFVTGWVEPAEQAGERIVRCTLQDITDRRRAEEQVAYLEMFDGLTRLPNRSYLEARLERLVLGTGGREQTPVAVLCIDLDRFDRVNQALGHAYGDLLLRAVGERLVESVRGTDVVSREPEQPEVSRFGGDVFTIVLKTPNPQLAAQRVASRVLRILAQPFRIGSHSIPLSASIGIALSPQDGKDPDALIGHAAAALARAKSAHGGTYHFFDPSVNQDTSHQLALESDLAEAIPGGQFTLEYQPQCDAQTGALVCVEALVRWNHPRLGRLMPGDFIPAAEACGLINALSEWVLREACRQLREWDAAGWAPFRVGVNLSSLQFHHGMVAENVEQVLLDTGLEPARLELEITESALLGEGEHVLQTCQDLRALGVGLALDDFGTGFSSLSHLFRFQIDTLKIDRSFVSAIRPRDPACGIIAAVIAMAKRLDITVVAEGIEEEAQLAFLRDEGCDLLQGYGICRPATPAVLEAWIRERD